MLYKAKTIERKKLPSGAELINGVFIDVEGKEIEATIWKTDSKGSVFPGFDTLSVGSEIEGNPWTNPTTGKVNIYPPKEKKAGGNSANISNLMDKKAENIEKAQDRKSESIAYFNSVNSAIALINTKAYTEGGNALMDYREFIQKERDWFLAEYKKWTEKSPF